MKRTIFLLPIVAILLFGSCVSSEIKGARDGDLGAVKEFVNKGGDVNERKNRGMTLLMYAAGGGHIPIIDYLMGRGADLRIRDNRGYSAFLHGAAAGRNNSLESLLGYGASTEDKDNQGRTALMIAASLDLYGTAEYLLDRGCDPLAEDNSGWTALLIALDRSASQPSGLNRIYGLISGRGVSFSLSDAPVADIAFKAARSGNRDVLDILFGKGLDRFVKNGAGDSLLHAGIGHSEMAGYLLSLGLDKDGVNNKGETPLLQAVKMGATDSVRLLLREGAWTEQRDSSRKTALFYAAEGTDVEILRALILGGADVFVTDGAGNTALHVAARKGTADSVRLLLTAGIFVESANGSGETPYAVSFANAGEGEEIRKILLIAGANVPEAEKAAPETSEPVESADAAASATAAGETALPSEAAIQPEQAFFPAGDTAREETGTAEEEVPGAGGGSAAEQTAPALRTLTLSWPRINPSRAKGWSNRDKLTSKGRIILRYGTEGKEDVVQEFTLPMEGANGAEGSVDFDAAWNGTEPVTLIMIVETEQGKSLISEYPLGGDNGSGPVLFENFRYE